MAEQEPTRGNDPGAGHYEIRLAGTLDRRWASWFDGFTVCDPHDGTTIIAGPVADQAALHAVLQRVRDLGLPLASLSRIENPTNDTTSTPDTITRRTK